MWGLQHADLEKYFSAFLSHHAGQFDLATLFRALVFFSSDSWCFLFLFVLFVFSVLVFFFFFSLSFSLSLSLSDAERRCRRTTWSWRSGSATPTRSSHASSARAPRVDGGFRRWGLAYSAGPRATRETRVSRSLDSRLSDARLGKRRFLLGTLRRVNFPGDIVLATEPEATTRVSPSGCVSHEPEALSSHTLSTHAYEYSFWIQERFQKKWWKKSTIWFDFHFVLVLFFSVDEKNRPE